MITHSNQDLINLKKIGKIVGITLKEMINALKPGITTAQLDKLGANTLQKLGARSAPQLLYKFPGATCISVNDEVAHGIPGKRVIKPGDLVNIDVSAELNGYFADSGASIPIEPVSRLIFDICKTSKSALKKAVAAATAGADINRIGLLVETEAQTAGFTIIRNLCGHGVGRALHEEPHNILNYYDPQYKKKFKRGMTVALETFISAGADYVIDGSDGWTLKTPDAALVAQYEHTIVITENEPIILTEY